MGDSIDGGQQIFEVGTRMQTCLPNVGPPLPIWEVGWSTRSFSFTQLGLVYPLEFQT